MLSKTDVFVYCLFTAAALTTMGLGTALADMIKGVL